MEKKPKAYKVTRELFYIPEEGMWRCEAAIAMLKRPYTTVKVTEDSVEAFEAEDRALNNIRKLANANHVLEQNEEDERQLELDWGKGGRVK